eukprot:16012899-Heterocapsa_arctica.AAC.1
MRKSSLELQKREEHWEQEKRTLEAKADEWKKLYDEVVLKFDAYDVKEMKKLKEDSAKWAPQRAELTQRLEKLQEELKQKAELASVGQTLKTRCEEQQKSLAAAQAQ